MVSFQNSLQEIWQNVSLLENAAIYVGPNVSSYSTNSVVTVMVTEIASAAQRISRILNFQTNHKWHKTTFVSQPTIT